MSSLFSDDIKGHVDSEKGIAGYWRTQELTLVTIDKVYGPYGILMTHILNMCVFRQGIVADQPNLDS